MENELLTGEEADKLNNLSLHQILTTLPRIPFGTSGNTFKKVAPRIVCVDGTELSVQANEYAYCVPRNNDGPYTHVEVGYPSIDMPDTWKEFAEDWNSTKRGIFARVPIEYVYFFIAAHGGIDYRATLDLRD
jgi:hypothetical protein